MKKFFIRHLDNDYYSNSLFYMFFKVYTQTVSRETICVYRVFSHINIFKSFLTVGPIPLLYFQLLFSKQIFLAYLSRFLILIQKLIRFLTHRYGFNDRAKINCSLTQLFALPHFNYINIDSTCCNKDRRFHLYRCNYCKPSLRISDNKKFRLPRFLYRIQSISSKLLFRI